MCVLRGLKDEQPYRLTDKSLFLPSHSNSLPFVMNSSESDSSGVSMSSTLMSRSSGVSRKSSDSREPSLWSKDKFISGATNVRRLRWEDTARPPPPGGLTFSEFGGAVRTPGEKKELERATRVTSVRIVCRQEVTL